jgi:hypothetical protein
MVHALHLFDFDGTLANTPADTPENKRKYEEDQGIPWLISKTMSKQLTRKHKRTIPVRRGWWGRKETLQPPLVPDPAPAELFNKEVCDTFLESKNNDDALTLIMTGRHKGIGHNVLRILDDGGLVKINKVRSQDGKLHVQQIDDQVAVYFFGDDGPLPTSRKPQSTLPWKVWMMEQFLDIYREIQIVEWWEDREEHVREFRDLNNCIEQDVKVHHVT